jgi:hypothetical protein
MPLLPDLVQLLSDLGRLVEPHANVNRAPFAVLALEDIRIRRIGVCRSKMSLGLAVQGSDGKIGGAYRTVIAMSCASVE